jgi:RNA 3'-terminal phosphate cyclase-like protein
MMQTRSAIEVEGSGTFRHHLVCALLANRPVTISGLGDQRDKPGLVDFEVNFMKFLDRTTASSSFDVRNGSSELTFKPGLILGGVFSHAVPRTRSVTYIIEAALLFLPFAKHASEITFTGCTQHDMDLSLDTIRTVTTRWLRFFGVEASLRIVRRGAPPDGDGCVILTVGNVRRLRSVTAVERGKIRRIRGIAFSSNVSADLTRQAASASKGMLLNLLPDIYIVADNYQAPAGQRTAGTNGYGLLLVGESTSASCVLSSESIAQPGEDPAALGLRAAEQLLDEVSLGGCVDSHHQLFVLLLMALSPDEASTVKFGSITPSGVTAMTLMETYFAVSCAIKQEANPYDLDEFPSSTIISCIGSNCLNVAKKSG